MEDIFSRDKLYNQIYEYSRRFIPFKSLSKIGLNNLSPQKALEYLIVLGSNLIFLILAYLVIILLKDFPTPLYLSLLLIVIFSSILTGLKSALFTIAVIFFEVYLLLSDFSKPSADLSLYLELTFFVASAIIISFLIEFISGNTQVRKLKEQEKKYVSTFIKLNEQYTSAFQGVRARDEFLSLVSHELKTPLTVMLLNLHSTLNSIRSASLANFSVPQLVKVLQNCEQQIKWLTEIINDLLDISLITTGRMSLNLESSDLVAITKEVEKSFAELLKNKKIKLKLDSSEQVLGNWDQVRIKQVITNVLSNAIKYGQSKPIEIKIFKSHGNAKFIIKDSGIGIDPEDQKTIFELFKRATSQEEPQKGLGVGLFITHQIVKIHKGNIKISSSLKSGTTFTIELPLRP